MNHVLCVSGGTVDITVHELLTKLYLKELYKATGGPWGGIEVDKAFENVLTILFGKDTYEIVKRKCSYDYLDVLRGFEQIKRSIYPGSDTEQVVRMPLCFHQLLENESGESLAGRIASSVYKDDIRTKLDRMVLSAKLSQSLFNEVIDNIIEHVKQLLGKPELEELNSLLLVGGFAESEMLQQAMQSNFADKERALKVFIPKDPELAIVKGAVLFGFQPRNVKERIAPYTYGVKSVRPFLKDVHDETKCKKFLQKGVYKCDNLFAKFVEIGMPIRYGEVQGEREFQPLSEETRNVTIYIYACTERFPEYVTDKGCEKRAKVELELLEYNIPLDERIITVNFMFSDSEITVTAREKHSGNRVDVTWKLDAE